MESNELNELKFLLKLLDCRNHKAYLASSSFRNFKGKEKICQTLEQDGLIDFSREIAAVMITPPGRALLGMSTHSLPISEKELKVLEKINKSSGKIQPSKITVSSVKAADRDAILQSFSDRGLISVETKLKRQKAEVWLTEKGQGCLSQLMHHFQSLRQSKIAQMQGVLTPAQLQTPATPSLRKKPTDQDILQMIQDLDQQLVSDNYLPIFHLRKKLQPPLSRDELDQALYRLERNDKISLSSLEEMTAYSSDEIDTGIPQEIGGPLFFVIVN